MGLDVNANIGERALKELSKEAIVMGRVGTLHIGTKNLTNVVSCT